MVMNLGPLVEAARTVQNPDHTIALRNKALCRRAREADDVIATVSAQCSQAAQGWAHSGGQA